MKKLIMKFAKNYIIGSINDLFEKNKDNTATICSQIDIWTKKINDVSDLLNKLAKRCEDGNLDSEEADQTIAEIEIIIKNW